MKSKIKNKLFGKIITSLAFVACASMAQASTITINPLDSTVQVGDTFNVTVVGQGFTDGAVGTLGGGLLIDWNPSLLDLDSFSLTFAGDQFFAGAPVQDDVAGFLNADVSSFSNNGLAMDFDIAVLTFTAKSLGVSPLDLFVGTYPAGADIVWADGAGEAVRQPDFVGGSVTINAVPVPAAVWLFGSGLLGLIGVARRSNITRAA